MLIEQVSPTTTGTLACRRTARRPGIRLAAGHEDGDPAAAFGHPAAERPGFGQDDVPAFRLAGASFMI